MVTRLVAAFYDEWGVPVELRCVQYQLSSGSALKDITSEEQLLNYIDVSVVTLPIDQIFSLNAKLREMNIDDVSLIWKRLAALKVKSHLTRVTYDGKVHNDCIQVLHTCRIKRHWWKLVSDWTGSVKWYLTGDLYEKAEKCGIIVSENVENVGEDLLDVPSFQAPEVKALIEKETTSASLFGYPFKVVPFRGIRAIDVSSAKSIIVSEFWNVVSAVGTGLQELVCPAYGAVLVHDCGTLLRLKAPEFCTGFSVICGALETLRLPSEMMELHKRGGVVFQLHCDSLPKDLTVIDMSEYHDLVAMHFSVKLCYLTRLVVMLPHVSGIGCERFMEVMTGRSRVPVNAVVMSILDARQLKSFCVMDDIQYTKENVGAIQELMLWETYSLRDIDISTNYSVMLRLNALADVVRVKVQSAVHVVLDLNLGDKKSHIIIMDMRLPVTQANKVKVGLLMPSDYVACFCSTVLEAHDREKVTIDGRSVLLSVCRDMWRQCIDIADLMQ